MVSIWWLFAAFLAGGWMGVLLLVLMQISGGSDTAIDLGSDTGLGSETGTVSDAAMGC
jgi:hypothetical protein